MGRVMLIVKLLVVFVLELGTTTLILAVSGTKLQIIFVQIA